MRKEHKHYARPKRPFDKETIEEERAIIKKYGLKNKKEIWKTEHAINRIRSQAKKLITQPEQQEVFLARLTRLGLVQPNASLDNVLALTKEELLERHLQTIVLKKRLATTQKQARQLITHKKILIGDRIVSVPGYVVKKDEENKISVKKKKVKKEKPEPAKPIEEKAEEKAVEAKPVEAKPVEEVKG